MDVAARKIRFGGRHRSVAAKSFDRPRINRPIWFALVIAIAAASPSTAATHRTQNFMVQAATPVFARQVAESAEQYRRSLSMHWLGHDLPPWPSPCPINVVAGPNLAAQGVTEYNRAPVRDFRMEVVGTPRRILDSVLPHEITHTVLATHFGRPLPRWADEGICTTVEHAEERAKHEAKLREFLASRRGIAMNQLFLLTEYPNDVLPMYAQGYSVCRFLIEQRGPETLIAFLTDYMTHPSWTQNVRKHYGYDSLSQLQQRWLAWVAAGSGPVGQFAAATTIDPPPGVRDPQGPGAIGSTVSLPPSTNVAASTPAIGTKGSWYARGKSKGHKSSGTALAAIGTMAPPSVRASVGYAGQTFRPNTRYQSATAQPESTVGRFRAAIE